MMTRYQVQRSYVKQWVFRVGVFLVFLSSGPAQNFAGYAGSFLRIGTSARSLAMGSGFTAELDRGGFTAYHNPAGIPFLERRQVSFSHLGLALDRRMVISSFSTGLPPAAGLGIAWVSAGVQDIQGRSSSGQRTEMLTSSEDAVYISFAQKLKPWISIGFNVKILRNQLPVNDDNLAGTGIGFDIGIMVRPGKGRSFAVMVQDLNSNYQWNTEKVFSSSRLYKDSFPTLYRVGTNYRMDHLNIVGDLGVATNHESILGYRVRIGTEYEYRDNYFLRIGIGNLRIALGLGMKYALLKTDDSFLDYAFVIENPAGVAHVFTYVFNF